MAPAKQKPNVDTVQANETHCPQVETAALHVRAADKKWYRLLKKADRWSARR